MKLFLKGVLNLAAHLGSHSRSASQKINNTRITALLQRWVEDKGYARQDEGMEDIAYKLGISKEELSCYSRCVLHKNFLTWRKELRIKEAKELFKDEPELSCKQVGELVGIPDLSNFRKQFYEVNGVTVKDYMDKMRPDM